MKHTIFQEKCEFRSDESHRHGEGNVGTEDRGKASAEWGTTKEGFTGVGKYQGNQNRIGHWTDEDMDSRFRGLIGVQLEYN